MNKEQVTGKMEKLGGEARKEIGKVTNDKEGQARGAADEAKGAAKEAYGNAKETVKKAFNE